MGTQICGKPKSQLKKTLGQNGYMKQVPHCGSTNIRSLGTKFSCPGQMAPGDLCTPRLTGKSVLGISAKVYFISEEFDSFCRNLVNHEHFFYCSQSLNVLSIVKYWHVSAASLRHVHYN
jgi:hypothetical protein